MKWNQTEKDRYHLYVSSKNGTNERIYKAEIESQMEKTNIITGGKDGAEEYNLRAWDSRVHSTLCKIEN